MSVTTARLRTGVTENVKRVEDLTAGDRCRFFTEDSFRTVASVTTTSDCVTVTFESRNPMWLGLERNKDAGTSVEVAV